MSIAVSSGTAAGAAGAADLTLDLVECCAAAWANEQLVPNRHHPVRSKILHAAAGGGGNGAWAGALWGLRLDRRDAA
eukprot:5913259-Heterocapsa_arctica.AAC.1